MQLPINEQIHLTEFCPTDKTACVQNLSEREIYDRTLRIPHPYTETDFNNWLEVVAKATERHGEPCTVGSSCDVTCVWTTDSRHVRSLRT